MLCVCVFVCVCACVAACCDLDVVAVVDQEVRRLEVAMDEPLAVQVVPARVLASTHVVPLAVQPLPSRQYSKCSLTGNSQESRRPVRHPMRKPGVGRCESPASANAKARRRPVRKPGVDRCESPAWTGAKARRRPVREPGVGRQDRRWAELLLVERTCPATRPSSCAASAGR
jgi:hypothetical protein